MANKLQQDLGKSQLPPSHLQESLADFVATLDKVFDTVKTYERFKDDHSVLLVTDRTSIKAEATSSIEHLNQALNIFQVSHSLLQHILQLLTISKTKLSFHGNLSILSIEGSLLEIKQVLAREQPSLATLSLDVLPCPPPCAYFTGREELLRSLESKVFGPLPSLGRRVVTLIAKGGSGKTQMALQLVSKHKARFVICADGYCSEFHVCFQILICLVL